MAKAISGTLRKFWMDDGGATAIEYGLMAVLISAACIGGFSYFGASMKENYDGNSSTIGAALQGP